MKQLRVLELFSGIGGAHFALEESGLNYEVIAAVDINTSANEVYNLNFEGTPIWQRNIESLTESELATISPHLVWMSPPCQPFTRNGLKKDCDDLRTQPFLHIIELLKRLSTKPSYILLENVKGFEESHARNALIETLTECSYSFREFLLNPIRMGIPNSRERYYLLAKLKPLQFALSENKLSHMLPNAESYLSSEHSIPRLSPIIEDYLETTNWTKQTEHTIPFRTILRFGQLFDIVKQRDCRSCCFTKAYAHYVEGTGSVLQMDEAETWDEVMQEVKDLDDEVSAACAVERLRLRYFSPREIANLMGFPKRFKFPDHFQRKQCYRLLGNSLNVHIVSHLLNLITAGDFKD